MNDVSPRLPRTRGASEPIIRLRGVSKVFSTGTKAVEGVDLDLMPGEFLSILGPSGCGKSTLLRMIAGLGEASSGTISWAEGHGAKVRGGARDLGFVFQDPTLMPWASALDNVALPLILEGSRKDEAQAAARDKLALVGLSGFETAYPRELSGGMKMRVSIARGLVTQPSLLLMDEPFAALDEITRHRLNHDLLRLWQDVGFTAVFVTHSVFESVFLSQRIVVMAARPGRIVSALDVSAPHPRDEMFRTSAQYGELCRQASERLKMAIGG